MNRLLVVALGLCLWMGTYAESQEILVLDYLSGSNTATNALECLGLPFTEANDDASTAAALLGGTAWDLVIIDNPCCAMDFTIPELVAFVDNGGACILNYWNLDTSATLQAAFEVGSAIDITVPEGFSDSTAGVATEWTTPNDVSSGVTAGADLWFDNGDLMTATGTGEVIGTFVGGDAAVIRGNGGLTYVVSHDWDSLETEAARRLHANLIEALVPTGSPPCGPLNDDCSAASVVGFSDTVPFDTTPGTASGGIPACGGATAPIDVWYVLTAACDGDYTFEVTGASFAARVAVWSNCPTTGGADISCGDTTTTVSLIAGDVVYVQVGGQDAQTGSGELVVSSTAFVANDNCADAIPLASGTSSFDTSCATPDGVEPTCSLGDVVDVWYTFTAPCDGTLRVDTCGSGFDTVLAAWPGGTCPVPGDVSIACSDLGCGGVQSEMVLAVTTGDEFYIQVGGWDGATGAGTLNVECIISGGTVGDSCDDPVDISATGTGAIDLNGLTASGADPGCAGAAVVTDMWFTYTVPCDGQLVVAVDTDPSFDSVLAVWDACPSAGGVPIDCQDLPIFTPTSVIGGVTPGEIYYIQVSGWIGAIGTGDLTVTCETAPIASLTCSATGTDVTVSWSNPSIYDTIDVYLDGTLDQTLSGTDTLVTFSGLDALTTYEVCLEPSFGGVPAAQICCTVTTEGDSSDAHFIVAAELPGGLIDSVTAVQDALIGSGVDAANVVIVPDVTAISGTPLSVWVCRGTFPDNTAMTAAEGDRLVELVLDGARVYCSGGDTFAFDAPTAFATVDGVSAASVTDGGLDFHTGMFGEDLMLGLDATYIQDQLGNEFMDALVTAPAGEDMLGDDSRVIFVDDQTGGSALAFTTTVAYYEAGIVRVISSSSEFGGYGGDQVALINSMLSGFGLGSTPMDIFRRGDSNNDTTFDISDAVSTLSALFVAGSPPPPCADAADANDDGNFDISDAVYSLSALFVAGSPPPPAPGSSTCGEDPTADTLDCATPCP